MATERQIEAAAAAIANARGMRRGVPAISNILTVIKPMAGGKLYAEVMEDARAALDAAAAVADAGRHPNPITDAAERAVLGL